MCDPVTATSLALSAGGTYLQQNEEKKNAKRVQNARNNAFETGMIKQRQFADESGAAFNQNIDKQSRAKFDEEAAKESDRMKQAFGSVKTQPDYNKTGMLTSTPKNVVIANQNAMNEVDSETDRDLNNLAGLNSYSGAMFNQGLDRNQFIRLFGNLSDKASRESALIPLDVNAAGNNASKTPSLFPTLLRVGGMGMGLYSAANGITSFGDKVFQGPMPNGSVIPSQPGLFTSLKTIPSKVFGGLY